jgi:hypothetical protein
VAAGLLHDVQQVVTDLIEVSSNWRGKRRDKGCCATLCNTSATLALLFSENSEVGTESTIIAKLNAFVFANIFSYQRFECGCDLREISLVEKLSIDH